MEDEDLNNHARRQQLADRTNQLLAKYSNQIEQQQQISSDIEQEASSSTQHPSNTNYRLFAAKRDLNRNALRQLLDSSKTDNPEWAHASLHMLDSGSTHWKAQVRTDRPFPVLFDDFVDPIKFRYVATHRLGNATVVSVHKNQKLPFRVYQNESGLFVDEKGSFALQSDQSRATVAILEWANVKPVQTVQQLRDILHSCQTAHFTIKILPFEYEEWLWKRRPAAAQPVPPVEHPPPQRPPTPRSISPDEAPAEASRQGATADSSPTLDDSLGDDPAVVNGLPKPTSNNATVDHYKYFRDLYGDVVVEEFKPANIHKNFAYGKMWSRHKKMFGPECGPTCKCFTRLGYLTCSVVEEQRTNSKKWALALKERDTYPVGLAGHFASWAIPKLTETYTTESGPDIIKRLIHMWSLHRKQFRFGTTCKESCDCSEGWEFAFFKGALDDDERANSMPRKRAAANVPRLIPKKHKASTEGRVLFATCSHTSRVDDSRMDYPYDIEFKPYESLGIYVVTEDKHCTIVSVCPANPDRRLQAGTRVLATKIGSDTRPVSTWEDLKKRYEEAQESSETISITFTNVQVRAAFNYDRDWSSDGRYTGVNMSGWDGRCTKPPPRPATFTYPALANPTSVAPRFKCVVTGGGVLRGKGVRFSGSQSVYFNKEDPASELLQPRARMLSDSLGESNVASVAKDPLHQGSIKDMVYQLVDASALKGLDKIECRAQLETMAREVKDDLATAKSGPEKHELDLKDKLLKIYITATYVIHESAFLKHWTRLQIRVLSIDNIAVASISEAGARIDALPFTVYEKGASAPLMPLPWKNVAERIQYEDEEVSNPYQINHNEFVAKDRKFAIQIQKTGPGGSVYLGTAAVTLSEIYRACISSKHEWHELTVPVKKGSGSGPNVTLSVRRTETPDKNIRDKREKAKRFLKDVIEWLKRMNKDLSELERKEQTSLTKLGADVRVSGNMSILHAALFLRDVNFVRQILELGVPSKMRKTVLLVALNMSEVGNKLGEQLDDENEGETVKKVDPVLEEIITVLREEPSPFTTSTDISNDRALPHNDGPFLNEARPCIRDARKTTDKDSRDLVLPRLGPHTSWLITQHMQRFVCRQFKTLHQCTQPRGYCKFIHTYGRMEEGFDSLLSECRQRNFEPVPREEFDKGVKTKSVRVGDKLWWTAAYKHLRDDGPMKWVAQQTVIYAEGGQGEYVSPERISWYESEGAAIAALEDSVDVALYAESRGIKNFHPSPYH